MTVILSAFGGRLKSQPIDWPEGQPITIRMRLPLERHRGYQQDDATPPAVKECRFERTDRRILTASGPIATEYELVDF
jgi:hypothetical protein